jgi:hypothetical protein
VVVGKVISVVTSNGVVLSIQSIKLAPDVMTVPYEIPAELANSIVAYAS